MFLFETTFNVRAILNLHLLFFTKLIYKQLPPIIHFELNAMFPDIPCMKSIVKDKRRVVPLVSSQEQRALLVPRINRGPPAGFIPPFP